MNKRNRKKALKLKASIEDTKKPGSTDSNRWFRTMPVLGGLPSNAGNVNPENGVLKDVAVITLGEARGHGVQIDRAFLGRVVELGNDSKSGLKCRFGHPNASGTALGTFLGRAVNFSIKEDNPDIVRCDLHLDKIAEDTPNGNLYDYVIRMATKNPDMLGTSIVFKPGESRDPIEVSPEDVKFADMPIATIREFLAVDIVDDPAANEGGMFSRFSSTQIAGQFTRFLDDNPQIWAVVDEHPEIIAPFIERYRAYKENNNPTEVTKMPKENEAPETTPEVVPDNSNAAPEEAAPEAPATPEASAELSTPAAPAEPEAPAQTGGNDRVAELSKINEQYGATILAAAVADNLSFEQAGALAFAQAKKENDNLRKQLNAAPEGADPVTGGEVTEPVTPSKYAGKMSDALAARAEFFENKMNGGKQ